MGGISQTRSFAVAAAAGVSMMFAAQAASAKEYRIAVSNSYIGNEWRVEMINFMQAYAEKALKGKVTLTVNNSGTDAKSTLNGWPTRSRGKVMS
jgi:ABC-type sugar transport system substrate-binding protein